MANKKTNKKEIEKRKLKIFSIGQLLLLASSILKPGLKNSDWNIHTNRNLLQKLFCWVWALSKYAQ